MFDLKKIMTRAWAMFKSGWLFARNGFAECLRKAWAEARFLAMTHAERFAAHSTFKAAHSTKGE